MRHNHIRDLEAELMTEVCKDVRVEPELMPIDAQTIINGNTADKARLDVSGNGVWGPLEKTFLDIRIFHPNAPSYLGKKINQVEGARLYPDTAGIRSLMTIINIPGKLR